jgi:spermidine synthase
LAVATPLTETEFYEALSRRLGTHGIGIQIVGHYSFYPGPFSKVVADMKKVWEWLDFALVPVPFYISGLWGLGVYSNAPRDAGNPRPCEHPGLDYYNRDTHLAAFLHPNDFRRFLLSCDEEAGR